MRDAALALSTVLLLVVASALEAADPPGDPAVAAPTGGWFPRWFSFGKKAPEPKAAAKAKESAPPPTKTMPLQAAAAQRAQEEAALLRRQGVCLKLRMIAAQTGDEELRRKADQLDERAWKVYVQRTAHLPTSEASPASDEAILDRHLGTAGGLPAGNGFMAGGIIGGVAARREMP